MRHSWTRKLVRKAIVPFKHNINVLIVCATLSVRTLRVEEELCARRNWVSVIEGHDKVDIRTNLLPRGRIIPNWDIKCPRTVQISELLLFARYKMRNVYVDVEFCNYRDCFAVRFLITFTAFYSPFSAFAPCGH